MATMSLSLFCCVLMLLQDGTFPMVYHGHQARSGQYNSARDNVRNNPDSPLNDPAAPPVIGWTESDVGTVHHDPDSPHINDTSAPLLIGWTESKVQKVRRNAPPFPIHMMSKGIDVDITNFPHMLQLTVNGNSHCGASIISHWWAVTAAHCFNYRRRMQVIATLRAGANYFNFDGELHWVSRVVIHPEYLSKSWKYDIALLKVYEPFQYGPTINKIDLPNSDYRGAMAGDKAYVTGWENNTVGVNVRHFQYISVSLVGHKTCTEKYSGAHEMTISGDMICAGTEGKGICQE